MRFLFNFIFCLAVIIFCGASFLHTQIGSRFIGKFFRYSGIEKTEKTINSKRLSGEAMRLEASNLSAAVNARLEHLRDLPHLRQGANGGDRWGETDAGAVHQKDSSDVKERVADQQQRVEEQLEKMRDQLTTAQERVQAMRERAAAQKERMDAKVSRR